MTESYVERFAREQKKKTESGRTRQKPVKKVRKNSMYGEMQKKEVMDNGENIRDGKAEDNKSE